LAETNDFKLVIEQKSDLGRFTTRFNRCCREEASAQGMEGKWLFTLHNPSVMPFLQYADNRELRKQIWNAYQMRGNNDNQYDNKQIVRELVSLRAERAKFAGICQSCSLQIGGIHGRESNEVYDLLNRLWTPALAKAKKEALIYKPKSTNPERNLTFNLRLELLHRKNSKRTF
jgi:peptidyl-dipeptidase Dcp